MTAKKITTVNKIYEEVGSLIKTAKENIAKDAANQSKSSAEMFLESIGDTDLKLKDKIIEDNNRAIFLLLVDHVESDAYKVMAVCFNKSKNVITNFTFFNRRDTKPIEDYVRDRTFSNDYMGKITDECSREHCEYSYEDGIIYFLGEKGDLHIQIADLNKDAVKHIANVLKEAEDCKEELYSFEIDNTKYAAVNKKEVDALLGKKRCSIYSFLATLDFIYSKKENNKTRYEYRERIKDENGELHDNKYFAINLEKLAAAMVAMKESE